MQKTIKQQEKEGNNNTQETTNISNGSFLLFHFSSAFWSEFCDFRNMKQKNTISPWSLFFFQGVKLSKSDAGKIGSVVHCVREVKERGSDPKTNILEAQNDGIS